MISISQSLEHMAWSNENVFAKLLEMPEEIYSLRAAEGEWPIGQILTHFIGAGEWYRFLLTGEKWGDVKKVTNHSMLKESIRYLNQLDQSLIVESSKEDAVILFANDEGEQEKTTRSLVLAQAVMHTAEHKGQLATILKMHGFHLNLDAFDHWAFASTKS